MMYITICARLFACFLLILVGISLAVAEPRIQVINESIEKLNVHPFLLEDLEPGDQVFVRVDTVSGSLDPVIALVAANVEFSRLEELYREEVLDIVSADDEYQIVFPQFADRHLGAWSQGGGPRGSLVFDVENGQDYLLLVFGADSWVDGRHVASFGDYRLQIGVNAPKAIEHVTQDLGQAVARPVRNLHRAVQEYRGVFPVDGGPVTIPLTAINSGETLFVYVETDQPSVKPSLKLRDFGGRLLAHDNIRGSKGRALIENTFPTEDLTATLEIKGLGQPESAANNGFRTLIGLNEPAVLQGEVASHGRDLVRYPIEVNVALKVDQITSISQRDENFTVVGQLDLFWVDPKLAFNPASCKCNKKIFAADALRSQAGEMGVRVPSYIFLNQQGKRHSQETTVTVRPDGSARLFERFSVTLQAPDFDLRRLPFDEQKFFIRLGLLESVRHFVFVADPKFNLVGETLGEEEWMITSWETSVGESGLRDKYSQFDFLMHAQRHIMYYFVRIFIPLGLLIAVSWVSFFLRDYSKRVDVSAGNLLAFIAFNFTLGSDLPRLGYLTFLDQLMVVAFVFAAMMVIYNVVMRHYERVGMPERLEKADSMLLWAYPLFYLLAVFVLLELTG